jgi:hypothetical protein
MARCLLGVSFPPKRTISAFAAKYFFLNSVSRETPRQLRY